jgi:hypothetical protein
VVFGGVAEEGDVGEDVVGWGLGGVAAGEGDFVEFGKGEEAVEEVVEPSGVAGDGLGDGEGEEAGEGRCAHGG